MKSAIVTTLLCVLLSAGTNAQIFVGGGNIRYEPRGAAPVIFNHEKHVAANGRKCSSCHFGIFLMKKEALKMNMSMMTKGHFCGACHNGKTSFDVEDHAQCTRCHHVDGEHHP